MMADGINQRHLRQLRVLYNIFFFYLNFNLLTQTVQMLFNEFSIEIVLFFYAKTIRQHYQYIRGKAASTAMRNFTSGA